MSENSETEPLYEIDFGGYGNTVTFIRAGKFHKLPRLDEVEGEILNCDKYKDFMITWDAHTINVRHGLDDSRPPFLTWTSTTTLWPIRQLSYTEITTSSLGTASPITTTNGKTSLSQSVKTNDAPSTYGSTTIKEHQLPVSTHFLATFKVTPPTSLKTTEASDFQATSEQTPCAASCTQTCACNCPTAPDTPTSSNTLAQLKIDKKTLSSYKRRHKSAWDPRKSSFYIGCVGITVLVLSAAFIVILDFIPTCRG
ncbi:Hypothetical predicted protein [Mytilus galloprovincialis]|uniref:Farnesoic acid O-methyl transferase domain-containing protein n=1 Tax=Mytilus galloprovincialis TaxID=29158 RepID=A0A8B6FSX6_MYTGA|nr:Hypothetical predicted protein [Mytilus galloprovincialis]